ncbi:MAG: hypothetical protein VW270_05870 [Candidatus Poseidoniales archaeon]|jgi:hypothetical protein
MATLNFIMPSELSEGFCEREEKQNKVKHTWLPSGQSRALPNGNVGIECYCKHCGQREWGTVTQVEYAMISEYWTEL